MVHRLEIIQTTYKAVTILFVAVYFGSLVYLYTVNVSPSFDDFFSALTAFNALTMVPFFGVATFFGYIVRVQLETIRKVCREEEENVFRRHGFALECDFEFNKHSSGHYVYFLLLGDTVGDNEANYRNSFLRIQVWNGIFLWNSILLPALASYESLPTGFETLPHDDWVEFWSKLTRVSRESRSPMRLLVVYPWTIPVLFFSTFLMNVEIMSEYFAAVIFLLFLFSTFFYSLAARQFRDVIAKPPLIVGEYAAKFAIQGVTMFHWCSGPNGEHFIYLFRRTTENLVLPEEGGSIKCESVATIRRRGENALV
jgi:hypothetical protein